ncbi:propanediol dehydratase large subunit [Roseiarcus fermentans]|uniref:Propanediol dehydratase large subunit n=1 Tax=Roseiarcus fermentans TaxID=1473586 RepID=A0A366F6X7_9HYPH|nr:propanediol/glycerol family dehydratase large subunit [Roseiarcus fermentans]RBP09896.1 propanediol dehydratase large subunit [Roseiarcus fermentans]
MDEISPNKRRWRRFEEWDLRPLRLDSFAEENPEDGFSVFSSPYDPKPSLRLAADGAVLEMDGRAATDFDVLDAFIARHHIDPEVAGEAMEMDSARIARMLVDVNVPRPRLERLARGMTPAKLTEVLGLLNALETTFAYSKMRQRNSPGNQAHVTNAKDDPLQLAADAAVAVGLGFDEIETTMRVAGNSWSNALACTVGAAVGRGSTLFQCSIEEAEELKIGLAGLATYAETVSVYGTEESFVDGDDTPWSKTFLTAAYASRGIKARCTSGASAELLMGYHERRSVLYLEARCLCLQRAMGVQGTQNGGIDGAPLTASMPAGVHELLAENLLAVWLGLECASGNDTRISESEIRVGAKITPYLLAGSDLITSGFGSVKAYDNSFNPSLFNGEELEDYLVLQRDFQVDGGLTPLAEEEALRLRRQAVEALADVLDELGLARADADMKESVIYASGSKETLTFSPVKTSEISRNIASRGLTALDVIRALATRGHEHVAKNVLLMLKQRVSGDYLQTSAVIRGGKVISAVNDPNSYSGPGTGYRMSSDKWNRVKSVRGTINREQVLAAEGGRNQSSDAPRLHGIGRAEQGRDPHEVVIGISPAFGERLHRTTAGHAVTDVLDALHAGILSGGGLPRIVRILHTADTSFLGLTAARLSGSGYGIGIQAKGTAVIHQRDKLPHMNLELFSNAPLVTLKQYRQMGANAARMTWGELPDPVIVVNDGQALGARFHTRVALLHAIETKMTAPGAEPVDQYFATREHNA